MECIRISIQDHSLLINRLFPAERTEEKVIKICRFQPDGTYHLLRAAL